VDKLKKIGQKLFFIASGALMFLLPFNGKLFSFFTTDSNRSLLPICIPVVLVLGFFTEKFTFNKLRGNWAFRGFGLLFSAYLLSALFNTGVSGSLEELTKKLSLLVVPFILITNRFFFVKNKRFLFSVYFFSILLTLLYLDVQAFFFYKEQNVFPFYTNYSMFTHPTYFGSNVLISIIFLFERIARTKRSWSRKTVQMILLLVLVIHLLFLLSKVVLICAIIVLLFYFFYLLFKDVLKLVLYMAVFTFPVLLIVFMPLSHSEITQNMVSRFSSLEHYNSASGGTAFRYKISKHTPEIVSNNWLLGVGVGNEQSYLMKFYQEHDWDFSHERGLNSHNQFVQTCLSVGLFGVLVLLAMLLVPLFINEFDGKKVMLLCFVFLFCTEAMLERQAGIVLFVFFYLFSFSLQGSGEMKKKAAAKK
jgi:O-antigen ligase